MGNTKLLGQIPIVQGIRESGDEGKPAILDGDKQVLIEFNKLAENTAKQIQERNNTTSPTQQVQININ